MARQIIKVKKEEGRRKADILQFQANIYLKAYTPTNLTVRKTLATALPKFKIRTYFSMRTS